MKWLIVGAGFTGAVLAERIASQLGHKVVIIDKRSHIGGNASDYYDEAGVLVHKYGPHIFHTNSQAIIDYLSQFTAWRDYEHRTLAWVDGQYIPVPFNFTSMEMVFGLAEGARLNKLLSDEFGTEVKVPILKILESKSPDICKIGQFIYEKVFLYYTIKQWGLSPLELDPSVTARVPVHLSRDDRYFQDTFQCMPAKGYTEMFKRILAHPLIETQLEMSFEDIQPNRFDRIIFTGPIDEYFGQRHGPLPYRSLNFSLATQRTALKAAVLNFPTPATQHPYTRDVDYRIISGQNDLTHTTVGLEYPVPYTLGVNEPYYPIPRQENREIYRKYQADASKLKNVIFAGRLADYSYYNMDQAVGRALSCFEKEVAQ